MAVKIKPAPRSEYLDDVAECLKGPSPFLSFQMLEIEHGRPGLLDDNHGDRLGSLVQGYTCECPFCWDGMAFIVQVPGTAGPYEGKPVYRVVCQRPSCGAAGPERRSIKAAIRGWNRRGLNTVPTYRVLARACDEIARLRYRLRIAPPKVRRTLRRVTDILYTVVKRQITLKAEATKAAKREANG